MKWIDIENKLPKKKDRRYLAYCWHHDMIFFLWYTMSGEWKDVEDNNYYKVTHWKKSPKKPIFPNE